MGAASQLKKLYQQAIGGVAPSDAASSSGSLAAMVKYLVANAGAAPKMPAVITTISRQSLGVSIAAIGSTPANISWWGANFAIYVPLVVEETITVTKLFSVNGSSVSGNIDIGLYDESGTKKISTGSVAQSGPNQAQVIDVADTQLTPGRYYFGLAASGAANFLGYSLSGAQPYAVGGQYLQSSAFPLPNTATFGAGGSVSIVPIVGVLVSPRTVL